MAQNYTSTEINAAVTKLVRDAIRRSYGSLGNRELGNSFSDVMDAAAGVFMTTPNAPFYVVSLGSQRLREAIALNLAEVEELVDVITSTNRRVKPVENLTSLGNARVALGALSTASATRTSQFENIVEAPAFKRFDSNSERFLRQEGRNVRQGSDVVRTPQQARSELAGILKSALNNYSIIQTKSASIENSIPDFNTLNLPSTLSRNILANAQNLLQGDIEKLEALDPQSRLQILRQVVLNVLSVRAAVNGFGSLTPKGTFVSLSGAGSPYADSAHPGVQASLTSLLGDPFTVLAGTDELDFIVDGAFSFTLNLPRSFPAKLEGLVAEAFTIDSTNENLTITIEGFPDLVLALSTGNLAAQVVANEINAAITTQPIIAEPYFNPLKFTGAVNIENSNPGPDTADFVRLEGPWSDVGVVAGDRVLITDPTSAMDGFIFSVGTPAGDTFQGILIGVGAPVDEVGTVLEVGPSNRFLRIRISDAGEEDAVDNRRALGIAVVDDGAAGTLGLVEGASIRSRGTRANEIADSLNSQPASAPGNTPRLEVTTVFGAFRTFSARSDPNDPLRLIASRYRTTGDATVGGFSATFVVSGAAAAGVVIGDRLTIRASTISGNVGAQGTVFSVSDTQVQAAMAVSVTTDTGMDIEFAPFAAIGRDLVVRISDPSPNSGDYFSDTISTDLTAVTLQRPLPVFTGPGGQPVTFEVEEGQNYPVFSSTSLLTNSRIEVDGSAFSELWGIAGPDVVVGTTPFVRVPSDPKTIELGDSLEVHQLDYANPDVTAVIVGLELSQLLFEVDPPIPSTTNINFSNSSPIPFTRIRKGQFNSFDQTAVALSAWTSLPANRNNYASELNRAINPLLVNTNPTIGDVNTAKLQAQQLSTALTQLDTILAAYTADIVPRVDTLVDTMLERGADRAVDTLLEGRFSAFFGYNSDEVSYIGNALTQMRAVQRLDLPVRRVGRQERLDTELSLGEAEEADFEFDQSDTDTGEDVDIPGQFIFENGGGGSF